MRGDTLPFFSTGLANFGVTSSNFLSMQECFWALIQWTHTFCGFEPNFLIAPLDNTQPGFSQFRHDPLSRGQYGGVRHTWGGQITSLICGLPSIALFRVGMTSSNCLLHACFVHTCNLHTVFCWWGISAAPLNVRVFRWSVLWEMICALCVEYWVFWVTPRGKEWPTSR